MSIGQQNPKGIRDVQLSQAHIFLGNKRAFAHPGPLVPKTPLAMHFQPNATFGHENKVIVAAEDRTRLQVEHTPP